MRQLFRSRKKILLIDAGQSQGGQRSLKDCRLKILK